MIDHDRHPVEWAMWLDELADAHEHPSPLLSAVSAASSLNEEDVRIRLSTSMRTSIAVGIAEISSANLQTKNGTSRASCHPMSRRSAVAPVYRSAVCIEACIRFDSMSPHHENP